MLLMWLNIQSVMSVNWTIQACADNHMGCFWTASIECVPFKCISVRTNLAAVVVFTRD